MLFEASLLAALPAALPLLREAVRQPVAQRRRGSSAGFAGITGARTRFDWHGPSNGPVTVCIHGLTTPSFVWDALLPVWTAMGNRVLTYDLFGRGLSDRPRGRQDADYFCSQLSALLADQGVSGPIRLCGYSMGGAIATAFAARNRDRIHRMTLLAPAGMGHELGALVNRAARLPVLGDWAFHMGFPGHHRRTSRAEPAPRAIPDLPARLVAEVSRRGYVGSVLSSLRGILAHPMEDEHRAIAAAGLPVTAIWGDTDAVIPLACRDVLRGWNPAARHAVVYGAGHGLTFTHPEAVLAAMPLRD